MKNKVNRTANGNEPSHYLGQEIKFCDDTIGIHYKELSGATLDFAVGLALGYKSNILECKTGGHWIGYDIVDNPIQPFWRCVRGHREGRGKIPIKSCSFQPSQDSVDLIDLIQEFRINVRSYDYHWAECTIVKNGVEYKSNESLYDAVCRVVVLSQLGEIVDIPIDLTKEIELSYKIVG